MLQMVKKAVKHCWVGCGFEFQQKHPFLEIS